MNRIVSSSELLQESSNELYDVLLSAISPTVGAVEYIKRKHKEFLIKKEIGSLYRKKEEFILTLLDTLPGEVSVEEYEETGKKLKEIQEIPDFKQEFDKIQSVFISLDQQDQKNIILEATEKIQQLFSKIRKEISVGLIESPDPGDMIVLGRALRCGEFLLDDVAESMKKSPPDLDETNSCINILLVFLVKIMAISIGKVEVQDLYTDIAFFTYICKPQSKEIGDDMAFTILESERK